MFLLDCGIMELPYAVIDERSHNDQDRLMSFPVEAFLIEHPDGLILFDTGCDPDGIAGGWPEAYRRIPFQGSSLPERLKAMGLKPDDIKYVVVSHLHFDHAGCLKLFKNSRIFVNETELDKTLHAYENGHDLDAHLESDIANWIHADLTWEKISPDVDVLALADGIKIVNFGSGHSWGMLGLMVGLPVSGNYFLVSDAVYTRKNLGPPEILPAMLCDKERYRKTVRFIESYAVRNSATVIYGHDLEQFKALMEETKGCME
jgi:glyoxylase-like metal-dependent hydrolase (beta-lactamase superfamily II)